MQKMKKLEKSDVAISMQRLQMEDLKLSNR